MDDGIRASYYFSPDGVVLKVDLIVQIFETSFPTLVCALSYAEEEEKFQSGRTYMPFERLHVGKWLMGVDRGATQAAYRSERPITACPCDYCKNYVAACNAKVAHSPAMVNLFQRLGISPEKEGEVYSLYANPEQTHVFYGGFYHLVGRIIDTADGPDHIPIDDHFEVAFTDQNDLLSPRFPQPALQMEFSGFIPWVLEEKLEYG